MGCISKSKKNKDEAVFYLKLGTLFYVTESPAYFVMAKFVKVNVLHDYMILPFMFFFSFCTTIPPSFPTSNIRLHSTARPILYTPARILKESNSRSPSSSPSYSILVFEILPLTKFSSSSHPPCCSDSLHLAFQPGGDCVLSTRWLSVYTLVSGSFVSVLWTSVLVFIILAIRL